jgi:integrase
MRRAECAGMTLDDVDLDQRIVRVLGKGRRPRVLPIGRKTAQALDRYLRAREGHRLGHLPHLAGCPHASRSGARRPAAQPGGDGERILIGYRGLSAVPDQRFPR